MFTGERRGFASHVRRATGVFLAVSIGWSSAPVGFEALFGEAKSAVQRFAGRPGPFSDARQRVQLGKNPDRDPYGIRHGWFKNPRLFRDLQRAVAKERSFRAGLTESAETSQDLGFLFRAAEPRPFDSLGGFETGSLITSTGSTSTTTTGTTTGSPTTGGGTSTTGTSGGSSTTGTLNGGGSGELSSRTGNRLTFVCPSWDGARQGTRAYRSRCTTTRWTSTPSTSGLGGATPTT